MTGAPAPQLHGLIAEPAVAPRQKFAGSVAATLVADSSGFQTRAIDALGLDFQGVVGDRHRGLTRPAGAREPWHPRGSVMRNERQLSIVSPDDLAAIAAALGIPRVKAEWLGANLVIAGVPRLSFLPARTRMLFAGGATLAIEGQNAPCRHAGEAIAAHYGDRADLALQFPKIARRLRGLVAWVERPGVIAPGATVDIRLPEQWIYA